MSDKYKIYLNDGEINVRMDGKNYNLTKTEALDMKYRLHQVIGKKIEWDSIHGWKPAYIDNEDDTI